MARKTGKYGSLYLGPDSAHLTKVGDIYDWVWEANTEMLPCAIKMDTFERVAASHGRAKFTAKRRLNTSAILAQNVFDSASIGEYLAFRLDLIDADNTLTQISGFGSVSQGGLTAPRDAVDDSFEMTVDGEYLITLPGSS
jgi:hypothetical protein